jgi:hypothetical protein
MMWESEARIDGAMFLRRHVKTTDVYLKTYGKF